MEPVRFGIISTAKIGMKSVIPAMLKGTHCRIDAIASRNLETARAAAEKLRIPRAYGSYDALLADPEIDAVYNPLPNHLHVPIASQAAKAGKHVLCEKPLGLDAKEVADLIAIRDETGMTVAEAFMVRHHPQWHQARELVRHGRIGDLRVVQASFSYMNTDPHDVRNQAAIGGGGLYDVGCYPIVTSRFVFGEEPIRVLGLLERDPTFQTDRLCSAIMHFPSGQAQFFCSTQLVPQQQVRILGTEGRIEMDIPFTPLEHETSHVAVAEGAKRGRDLSEEFLFEGINQYTLQGDHFARVIRGEALLEFPLEDACRNMAVIDAIYRSGESGGWETVSSPA